MYVEGNPVAYADFSGHASIGGFFKGLLKDTREIANYICI
jgi:hypothetical protein